MRSDADRLATLEHVAEAAARVVPIAHYVESGGAKCVPHCPADAPHVGSSSDEVSGS